jgi:hypothetical protein
LGSQASSWVVREVAPPLMYAVVWCRQNCTHRCSFESSVVELVVV